MNVDFKNRWYDKYPDLSDRMEKVKDLKKRERDIIILDINDRIMDYDNELINRHVLEFPMTYRRRWYDKDPYSWLIINALKYANKELITDVILYLKGKL